MKLLLQVLLSKGCRLSTFPSPFFELNEKSVLRGEGHVYKVEMSHAHKVMMQSGRDTASFVLKMLLLSNSKLKIPKCHLAKTEN